jgi:hypothetical protein
MVADRVLIIGPFAVQNSITIRIFTDVRLPHRGAGSLHVILPLYHMRVRLTSADDLMFFGIDPTIR